MLDHRARVILAFLAVSPLGCKARVDGTSGLRDDSPVPLAPPNDADASADPDCGEVDAVSSEKVSGEEAFDLTSRCVFNRDVHTVRIRILGETFQKVLDDGCADRDSGFGHVIELVLDGQSIKNVGIKVRGNTSACNPKRQFKFKFDAKKAFSVFQGQKTVLEFPENDDRTFFGLSGFSVRTSANDATQIRERTSSRVFTAVDSLQPTAARGGLVYRVSFAKLFVSFNRTANEGPEGSFTRLIDGYYYDYKGFYSLAENIDKTFLRTRFQRGDSKLKGYYLYQADKAAGFFERSKYSRRGWAAEYVDGKSVEDEEALKKGDAKIMSLFDLLANNPNEAALAEQIDVDNVVNYVTGAELVGHWDSMLANRNNDWLFFNPETKKWQIIIWDLDNSVGALHDQYDALMSSNIYQPARTFKGRLFEVLFSEDHPNFRAKLRGRLKAMVNGYCSGQQFNSMVDQLSQQVRTNVEGWEGYNPQAFEDIKSFMKSRRDKINSQL